MNKVTKLPKEWELVKFGGICEPSQYGYTAKAGTAGNYYFLRTTDITKEQLNWHGVPFCNIDEGEAEKYLLKDGDIVISRAGSIGFSYLISKPPKAVFASYLIRFRPLVNARYLQYFLKTPAYWDAIEENSTGIAVQNVNAKTLSMIDVPLAPEKEQARIVDKLEDLFSEQDNSVAELKAAQLNLKKYRQSLLKSAVEGELTRSWREQNHDKITESGEQLLARILKERREFWLQQKLAEFKEKGKKPTKNWQEKYPEPVKPNTSELPELPQGWVWTTLSTIAEFIQIGPFGSLLHKQDYIENGVPLINPSHIKDMRIKANYRLTVSDYKLSELHKYVMKQDDIVIGRRGEMGRCAVITEKEDGWLCGTGSLFIRLLDGMNSEFYSRVLSSKRVKDHLGEFSVGTTMQNLNQKILHSVPVPLCINKEQLIIARELEVEYDSVAEQSRSIQFNLKQSEAQRKNILKEAFAGKLIPQDLNDEPASVLLDKVKQRRAELAKQATSKRMKKKSLIMKKIDAQTIKSWITSHQQAEFTFAQLQDHFSGDYDALKEGMFALLSENKRIVEQSFDQDAGCMRFKKVMT